MRPPRFRTAVAAGLLATLAMAAPVAAITNGVPDDFEHPHVGQLFFYVPDEEDPRFDDPGSWFNCSGTLISPTVVLTAGHCTFGTGLNGEPTTAGGGDGGNDVWVTFVEDVTPFYDTLPPSLSFAPDRNADRYDAWTALLEASDDWIRGTALPHPQFDNDAFYVHDAGVVILDEPVELGTEFDAGHPVTEYGTLPDEGFLDQFKNSKLRQAARFEPVGYGVEQSFGYGQLGGDTRMKANSRLINIEVVLGIKDDIAAAFSNNNGKNHKGGTCSGDSGGPIFVSNDTTIVAINSFGISGSCKGVDGGYRIDQADDLDWLHEVLANN